MDPHSKKFKTILAGVFIVILIIAALGAFSATNKYDFRSPIKKEIPKEIAIEENGEPTEEFYNVIQEKTYVEMKTKAPNLVTSPNLLYAEQRDKLIEMAGLNPAPNNQLVVYSNDGLSAKTISITQGDLVTFKNDSQTELMVIGRDDWQTYAPIPSGEGFSQRFDFLGKYDFSIEGTEITGTIIVNKPDR